MNAAAQATNPSTPGDSMSQLDAEMGEILAQTRTVAVVGIKSEPTEDAHRIPLYLQAHGYRIVPINPKLSEVLGERAYGSLSELASEYDGDPVDLVDLFRATDHIPHHVDEILAMQPLPRAVWMQLGIHHGEAAARLRAAGIHVVQDRCIMVEHRRLAPHHEGVRTDSK